MPINSKAKGARGDLDFILKSKPELSVFCLQRLMHDLAEIQQKLYELRDKRALEQMNQELPDK